MKLLTLFILLSVLPLATLGWLGWRLLEQDRALENQRLRERLESAGVLLAKELDRGLAAWEDVLPATAPGSAATVPPAVPPGAVLLVFDSHGNLSHHGIPLPYYPLAGSLPETHDDVFAVAEAQEFRGENPAKVVASYRTLASTKDRRLRAAALMRLARLLRKQQQIKEALAVYGELAALGDTGVAGSPSELVARRERIALFKMIGDEEAGKRETTLLASLLSEGRLPMDRATFDFYSESIPRPPPPANRALQLAEAVEGVWPVWQQQPSGRTAWTGDGGAFAAVWRPTSTGTAAIVGRVDTLMESTAAVAESLQVRLAMEDPAGRVSWGGQHTGDAEIIRCSHSWRRRVARRRGRSKVRCSGRSLRTAGRLPRRRGSSSRGKTSRPTAAR